MKNRKNTIKLKVKKIKDSVAFYKTIGFAIPGFDGNDRPIIISGGGGNFDLSLIPAHHAMDEDTGAYELIQIFYPTSKEVDDAFNKTAMKGFETVTKPWDTFWSTRSAKVVDPDGNNVLLYTHLK